MALVYFPLYFRCQAYAPEQYHYTITPFTPSAGGHQQGLIYQAVVGWAARGKEGGCHMTQEYSQYYNEQM